MTNNDYQPTAAEQSQQPTAEPGHTRPATGFVGPEQKAQPAGDDAPNSPVVFSAPTAAEIGQVLAAIQALTIAFEDLQQGFDSKIKYDTSKERIIDTLHKELQAYRDGLHFQVLRPIFLDLIAMHDDLNSLLRYAPQAETTSEHEAQWRDNLVSFQDSIESALYRHGVEPYTVEGEQFTAQRQRSIKLVSTAIPEEDRLIAERVRKGFCYGERILRPELVSTFKYTAGQNKSAAEDVLTQQNQ